MPNFTELLNQITSAPILQNPAVHYALIILPAVCGLVYCLYGYRLIRLISTVIGAVIGVAVGCAIVHYVNPRFPVNLIIIVAGAVIFGLIGFFLYHLGIFLMVFPVVFGAVASMLSKYTTLDQLVVAIIALVSGLIMAILSVIYDRPLIIIASALGGALVLSGQVFDHLIQIRWDAKIEMYVCLGVSAVLALIGLIYQFRSTKGMKPLRSRDDDYED